MFLCITLLDIEEQAGKAMDCNAESLGRCNFDLSVAVT